MKYFILLLSTIILIIMVSFFMKDSPKYLFSFFLNSKKFEKISPEYWNKREISYNKTKRVEKEQGIDNITVSGRKLRTRIVKTLFIMIVVAVYSFFIAFLAKKLMQTSINDNILNWIQVSAIFLVLWALLGQLGWSIQTIKGISLPEYINDLWFRTLNVVAAHLFLFSYFFKNFDSK